MKVLLSSTTIGGKWKIKKQLFQNDHKLFLAAYDQNNPKNQVTLLIMNYDETIQQQFMKTSHQIKKISKQNRKTKLLIPEQPIVETLNKTKILAMILQEKPISLNWLINNKSYEFTPIEILQSAISGISSISELHSLNIVHGHINPKTCYFYNRQRIFGRKVGKIEISTYLAVCLADAEKFVLKSSALQNRLNDLLYESCAKALGLKAAFKDDLQSMLYVLIKMATGNSIFSYERYQKEWGTEQNIQKWKISSLYLQLLKKIPPNFSFLIRLYLHIQELNTGEKIDYSAIIKKLWVEKEKLMSRQSTLQVQSSVIKDEIKEDMILEQDDSQESIFEEDIKIDIRTQETTGFEKVRFLEEQ